MGLVEQTANNSEGESEPLLKSKALLLTDRLTEWARSRDVGERAAVAALIHEGDVLSRGDVRDLLVVDSGRVASLDWPRFEGQYRTALVLDTSERAFLDLVVAVGFPRLVPLWQVENLGERRLAIVLRALAALAGVDTIAVGTRAW
ncbi:hypothetical protein ACFV0R_07325 [Streptomyces sp. NPDC059578]|uniref:hypothetical protein n=1 Tax=Streptomyces sp. NPDC059578 TaxID=3346874 RepID=UPI0036C4540E